ncbi:hypothetical protein DPEC_G00336760 [Dallia pectoralis]|uniref:Uncharacterized protein n=1 Tax=Dallia pectoralis TaxID=75939 RepID=A0ACC2F7A0_DALPE|nr:hypothetical protein DPEC_G00336760 [Dallia pectoralis]
MINGGRYAARFRGSEDAAQAPSQASPRPNTELRSHSTFSVFALGGSAEMDLSAIGRPGTMQNTHADTTDRISPAFDVCLYPGAFSSHPASDAICDKRNEENGGSTPENHHGRV